MWPMKSLEKKNTSRPSISKQAPSVKKKKISNGTKSTHLVVVGLDEIVTNKYLSCFDHAIKMGQIDAYSIIELETQKEKIERRLQSLEPKPKNIFYLPDTRFKGNWADPAEIESIFDILIRSNGDLKVYIAAELKAHENYLRYCVEKGIDSLVEKPVIAPMKDELFDPFAIDSLMHSLVRKAEEKPAIHSVMTLSRYHKIYNYEVLEPLKTIMLELEAPLTSLHFRTAGGVWNLHREYESREDHPYKYGYGMLMHGAYHYIDLVSQFLTLNKLVFPNNKFTLTLSSFVAYPTDQNERISKKFSEDFDDNRPDWHSTTSNSTKYGETDITTIFCLKNKENGKTITLGTISLEQTTPSIRSWKDIPEDIYNKNGRISSVDLEAQLSTLHSVNVQCFDVPVRINQHVDRIDAFARVSTRTNASLLKDKEYSSTKTFTGLFHSDSNRQLMYRWLNGDENRSLLKDHMSPMRITKVIALTIQKPGYPITIDFM
jgi:hypothetical protein